jgi:hypothetical protein
MTTFKHLIGKSTLKEGITIHKNFGSFFESPDAGQKREITLIYSNDQSAIVVLRRLDNIRKHAQIKYTNKTQEPFVEWLNEVFVATRQGSIGEFLEFEKVRADVFKLRPITIDIAHNVKLYVADSMYHKTDQNALKEEDSFLEIGKIRLFQSMIGRER